MKQSTKRTVRLRSFAAALLVLGAAAVQAQEATGNLYAKVMDTDGRPLPGVTCELAGLGASQLRVTTIHGEARWLALDPGRWSLRCALDGFSPVEISSVDVDAARNTSVEAALIAAVTEVILVTAENPLLDRRKLATGTSITQIELEKIPTGHDPWSVLGQTPGVLVSNINVGGSESGQQSAFRAPGVSHDENAWIVDGVEITSMSGARGSSPTYYDFHQFTEIDVQTGGTDITKAVAGVSVNLVTKRGSNEFRGSARFFHTDDEMFSLFSQDIPVRTQPAADLAPSQRSFVGNTVDLIEEYGFEAGGPILRDKLWAWGSWGVNDIKQRTGGATLADVDPVDVRLENTALRVNAQPSQANSLVASWNDGLKERPGALSGPGFSTAANVDALGPQTSILKLEDTHVVNSGLFLGATVAKVDNGFSFACHACLAAASLAATPEAALDADGVWQNGFQSGSSESSQELWKLHASYFFTSGPASHELKLGARVRRFESSGEFAWPGRNLFTISLAPQTMLVIAARGEEALVSEEYRSIWLQDTVSAGSWTLTGGLRYDRQGGANEPQSVDGNAAFPDILPPVHFGGAGQGFDDWESISPRIGVTYAQGEERKTLIRASYARFAEQLPSSFVTHTNPLSLSYGYFYVWDVNDNLHWDEDEDMILGSFCAGCGNQESPNRVDPDLQPSMTDEVILGVERSFMPELVGGVNLTWRNTSDVKSNYGVSMNRLMISDPLTGGERPATASDYVPDGTVNGVLPDGRPYEVPTFAIFCGNSCLTGGSYLEGTDRDIDYLGATVSFTKRLANRWMARGYVTYGRSEWRIGESFHARYEPNPNQLGTDIDGGVHAGVHNGRGRLTVLHSDWMANLNGMYQFALEQPWGFNVSANVYAREGYPSPYFLSATTGSDGVPREIRVVDRIDDYQVDDVLIVDARIDKAFAASGKVSLTVSLDAFNLLNEDYVLRREIDLGFASADYLRETLPPRTWRLGVRINWR